MPRGSGPRAEGCGRLRLPAVPGAGGDQRRAALIAVNLRRGFLRLAIGVAVLWLVFWTFAYVLKPRVSENAPPLPALSLTTEIAVAFTAVLGLPWVVAGFRQDQRRPTGQTRGRNQGRWRS